MTDLVRKLLATGAAVSMIAVAACSKTEEAPETTAAADAAATGAAADAEAAMQAGGIDAAVDALRSEIDPSDDLHGSADYRRHLAGVLCRRVLEAAMERAGT